jgi:hypothetical protein
VGVVESLDQLGNQPDCLRKVTQARATNFAFIREVVFWEPGWSEPKPRNLEALRACVEEANVQGLEVMLTIAPNWELAKLATPRTPARIRQFAAYAAAWVWALPQVSMVEIGNEPNSPRFLQPQCSNRGRSLAPLIYFRMMAASYDAVKAAAYHRGSPVTVFGGATSSNGSDRPCSHKPNHSPIRFLKGVARAYRNSGRSRPIVDHFSHHPYKVKNTDWVGQVHRGGIVSVADLPRLRLAIQRFFLWTAQPTDRPIFLSEYGVETTIPLTRVGHYDGTENQIGVPNRVQREDYLWVLRYLVGKPWIWGLAFFHTEDEKLRSGWQSGLFYADPGNTPKSSAKAVSEMVACIQAGTTQCG